MILTELRSVFVCPIELGSLCSLRADPSIGLRVPYRIDSGEVKN